MKTIKIKEDQLRDLLKELINIAHQFEWTGWRIPIYVDKRGNVSAGNWLSNNSWQPDAIELPTKVETWSMNDCGFEGDFTEDDLKEGQDGYNQADMDYIIDESIDYHIDQIKNDDNPMYVWKLV